MTALWAVLVGVGLVGASAFVVLYGWLSREWHRSHIGQNLMAMAAVLAGLLGLSLLGFLVRVPAALWLGGMASLDAVLWWRVALLWRVQRRR